MRYQVTLFKNGVFIRKEMFTSYESAMAFFESNSKSCQCELRDSRDDSWRYRTAA